MLQGAAGACQWEDVYAAGGLLLLGAAVGGRQLLPFVACYWYTAVARGLLLGNARGFIMLVCC